MSERKITTNTLVLLARLSGAAAAGGIPPITTLDTERFVV